MLGLGLGIVIGAAAASLLPSWASTGATFALWVGMGVPVVWAFARSRPVGLLRFRPVDVVFGLGFGLLLRLTQGWLEGADRLPSLATLDGRLPPGWWFSDLIAPVVIAPVIETLFFQGVILVTLYSVLRRPAGRLAAGVSAVLASAALFMLVHGLVAPLTLDEVVALALVGLVCGALVMLTGRIWPAVLAHVVYNAGGRTAAHRRHRRSLKRTGHRSRGIPSVHPLAPQGSCGAISLIQEASGGPRSGRSSASWMLDLR